jgi:hypothetical protein
MGISAEEISRGDPKIKGTVFKEVTRIRAFQRHGFIAEAQRAQRWILFLIQSATGSESLWLGEETAIGSETLPFGLKTDPFDDCGTYPKSCFEKWKPFYLAVSPRQIKNPFSACSAAPR